MTSGTTDSLAGMEETTTGVARPTWLEAATRQVELTGEALEAIDRCIGLGQGDVLVCETTCLAYAAHSLAIEVGPGELWLVPPSTTQGKVTAAMAGQVESALEESLGDIFSSLRQRGDVFRGLTASVPHGPFKLLVTTEYVTYDQSPLEWPLYNQFWVDMLKTEDASGAVIYPPQDAHGAEPLHISAISFGGSYSTGDFSGATELPGGHIVLSHCEGGMLPAMEGFDDTGLDLSTSSDLNWTFRMEDARDAADFWVRDVDAVTVSLNNGCLVPSAVRSGVEAVEIVKLCDIAKRVSRGTTLSEKKLDVEGTLHERMDRAKKDATPGMAALMSSDIWDYSKDDDLYYVDGSCIAEGRVSPMILRYIPKGQERYIVDSHDGEVLLVVRNNKGHALYSATHPTLIGNSVFVVRLATDIGRDYLTCWLRGSYAKEWLRNGGNMLSKKVLDNLPIPILDEVTMERTVRYERLVDEKILEFTQQISQLKGNNRFDPIKATKEFDGSRSDNGQH